MEPITVAILSEMFKKSLPSMTSLFKTKKEDLENYLESLFIPYIIERYNKLNTSTSQLFRNTPYQIDKLYVPLTLVRKDSSEKFKINKYPVEIFSENRKLLINDTAGMGKSTILKMIFRYAVDSKLIFPFYIDLKSLIKDGKVQKVEDYIISSFPSFTNTPSENFILKQLDSTKFLFLFDGADEIPDAMKTELYSVVNSFCDKCINSDFIVATRDEEVILSSFYDFTSHNIKSLEKLEAYTLLRRYDFKDVKADKLIEELEKIENRAVEEFLTNPLLTTLLYMSYSFNRTIPLKKSIFFKQIYHALYENHDATKLGYLTREKKCGLDIEEFEDIICHLAFISRLHEKLEYTRDELISLLNKISESHPTIHFNTKHFLEDMISRVPILRKDGLMFSWQHKSIQEYFFVRYIIRLDSEEKRIKITRNLIESNNSEKYSLVLDILFDEKEDLFHSQITKKIYELAKEFKPETTNKDNLHSIDIFYRYIAGEADLIFEDENLFNTLDEGNLGFNFISANKYLYEKFKLNGFNPSSAMISHSHRRIFCAVFQKPETVALQVLELKKMNFVSEIFGNDKIRNFMYISRKTRGKFKKSKLEPKIISNIHTNSTKEMIEILPDHFSFYVINFDMLEKFYANFLESKSAMNSLMEEFTF